MPNTATLRAQFNMILSDVWEIWHDHRGEPDGPFMELEMEEELDMDPGYNHSVGWALGVSQAMGWSTEDPNPKKRSRKSWDPRG